MINDPIYFLNIANRHCNFNINVNDIEVFAEKDDSNISSAFVLNKYLTPTENIIKIDLSPMTNENLLRSEAALDLSIEVNSKANSQIKKLLLKQGTPDFYHEDKSEIKLSNNYNMIIPFLPIPFVSNNLLSQEFELLNDDEQVYKQIVKTTKNIYNLFKNRDIKNIIKVVNEREKDLAFVNYEEFDFRILNFEKSLNKIFEDELDELLPLSPEEFTLKMEFGNKLASLVDKYGDPPIIYYNEIADMTIRYKFLFGRYKDKSDLFVIR